jgi:serine/threonine-protein kinase RsbW
MASPDEFAKVQRSQIHCADQCLAKPVSAPALITAIAIASSTRRLIHLANHFGRSAGLLLSDELPEGFPGFRLETLSGTASYGGGDFGLALKGKGFTRLVVGDIMGHGLKAKAGAIALSAIVRTLHSETDLPANLLLDKLSHVVNNEPAFTDIISTLIVVNAGEEGWIHASSAGHPPIATISKEESVVLPVTGPLLSLTDGLHYRLASHQLKPGDKIAIITDGIDNQSSATAEFPAKLLQKLSKDAGLPLADMRHAAERWLTRKLGPAPKDDWTLMLGEYCGSQKAQRRRKQKMHLG